MANQQLGKSFKMAFEYEEWLQLPLKVPRRQPPQLHLQSSNWFLSYQSPLPLPQPRPLHILNNYHYSVSICFWKPHDDDAVRLRTPRISKILLIECICCHEQISEGSNWLLLPQKLSSPMENQPKLCREYSLCFFFFFLQFSYSRLQDNF